MQEFSLNCPNGSLGTVPKLFVHRLPRKRKLINLNFPLLSASCAEGKIKNKRAVIALSLHAYHHYRNGKPQMTKYGHIW